MTWRYFATTLNGDGTETFLDTELPLSNVSITRTLSGVDSISAELAVEVAHLKDDDGNPVFREWSTALYAEKDGVLRAGGILQTMNVDNGNVSIVAEGFVGYLSRMPHEGDVSFIDTDPLVLARYLWEYTQAFDGGNIPVVLDNTVSPVRVGTEEREVTIETEDETVTFQAGPVRYNFWTTQDLGREFESLAQETPFDYREHHEWIGDTIRHRIELGYPTLGAQRSDLRFTYGENIVVPLGMAFNGDDYASEVVVLGAGEGRKMIRQRAALNAPSRLRRVTVVEAKEAQSDFQARAIARAELAYRGGDAEISVIVVRDHLNAPIGSFQPGDSILVQNHGGGWGGNPYVWVRILEYTITPEESDTATLTVTRAERTTV